MCLYNIIQGEVAWCLMFIDGIVLVDEIERHEQWWAALKSKWIRNSRGKIEIIVYKFKRNYK